jgi:hypothetical protein
MKVKTYLPIFSGFFHSQWEFDYNYIENFIQEERANKGLFSELNYDNVKIDNSSYEFDIVKSFCNVLPDLLPDYIKRIELEKICYPKTYNFANDSANVIIDINEENISSFIYSHKEKFCEFLKSRYTSYDGFISHYANDFETWEEDTKKFTDYSVNGHYLGSILDFICILQNIDNFTVYENIIESVDFLSYVENLEEVLNYSDGSLYECFTKNNYTEEVSRYYADTYENGFISQLNLNEKTLSIIKDYEKSLLEV